MPDSSNLFFNPNNTNMNEEQEIILEEAIFKFSQDANCLSNEDDFEQLEITAQSSIGIDRDNECFFTLKTEKWSVDNADDLKKLFDRIENVILKK